ncbi:3452_t:CDS:2 [Paraglomus brasilianum]|uniref:3452_t:CDS:1 n=1 Tax=Paraglomus brasilianum TaxID=144538 RepID=A0A9N9BBQ0_9GLOM|nr:3452_t:CDS:2 [Paraglomus brasilianum]
MASIRFLQRFKRSASEFKTFSRLDSFSTPQRRGAYALLAGFIVGAAGGSFLKLKKLEDAKGHIVAYAEGREPLSRKSSILDKGAELVQSFKPIDQIHQHLCGFQFYAHDMNRQLEVHQYCSHLSEDMRQCVMYDAPSKKGRLIGVEYIISDKLFESLPPEEKKFWHSHNYSVKSGLWVMPTGIPDIIHEPAERAELASLAKTYGKSFIFWQFDRGDRLPLGPPQLMMSFTDDWQLDQQVFARRDARYHLNTEAKRDERRRIPDMKVDPEADHWKSGKAWQPQMVKVPFKDVT